MINEAEKQVLGDTRLRPCLSPVPAEVGSKPHTQVLATHLNDKGRNDSHHASNHQEPEPHHSICFMLQSVDTSAPIKTAGPEDPKL
jgi:hypothetical protein